MALCVIIARSIACIVRRDPATLGIVVTVWRAFDPLAAAVVIASGVVTFGGADVPASLIVVITIGVVATLLRDN